MITEEKRKEIKKRLKSGYPAGELKNELLLQGYSEEEIEMAFNFSTKSKPTKQTKPKYQAFTLIGSCLLVTGIATNSTNTFLKKYAIPLIIIGSIFLIIPLIAKARKIDE
jgi:hypothetical protein